MDIPSALAQPWHRDADGTAIRKGRLVSEDQAQPVQPSPDRRPTSRFPVDIYWMPICIMLPTTLISGACVWAFIVVSGGPDFDWLDESGQGDAFWSLMPLMVASVFLTLSGTTAWLVAFAHFVLDGLRRRTWVWRNFLLLLGGVCSNLIVLLLLLAAVSVAMRSCAREPETKPGTYENTLITRTGRYPLASGGCIEVRIIPKTIVEFRLIDAQGAPRLVSTERASTVHRWALYWESRTERLWFYSGDVGSTVWSKDSNGHYAMEWIGRRLNIVSEMPEAFFRYFPSRDQQEWAPLRKPAP